MYQLCFFLSKNTNICRRHYYRTKRMRTLTTIYLKKRNVSIGHRCLLAYLSESWHAVCMKIAHNSSCWSSLNISLGLVCSNSYPCRQIDTAEGSNHFHSRLLTFCTDARTYGRTAEALNVPIALSAEAFKEKEWQQITHIIKRIFCSLLSHKINSW